MGAAQGALKTLQNRDRVYFMGPSSGGANETINEPGIEGFLGDMAKTRDLQEIYEILTDETPLGIITEDEVKVLNKRITMLFTEENLTEFLKKIESMSMSKEELQKIARICYKYKKLIKDPQYYDDFKGHHRDYEAFFEELDREITKKLEQLQERDYTEDLRALDTWRAEASGFDPNYKIRR